MKTIIILAIAALLSATAAYSDVVTKGGAAGLVNASAARTESAPAAAMSCGNCKSEFVKVAAPGSKGHGQSIQTLERHACSACGTKWVITGHGKAKVQTAVHTCGSCNS